jgi:adenine-specific DNA-methyltransferase
VGDYCANRDTRGSGALKGYIPTPAETVDLMADRLFRSKPPSKDSSILDPGCATGAFIAGIIRWCEDRKLAIPRIVGIDSDLRHLKEARAKFERYPSVEIRHADFLSNRLPEFDYVIGNPPYVPITALDEKEKARYRRSFATARGRFDLYLLFFEQALNCLAPGGRLAFITPEKFLYVDTAEPLRILLAEKRVEEILLLSENTFADLVTYPTVTVLSNMARNGRTKIKLRTGQKIAVHLAADGRSWMPALHGDLGKTDGPALEDICVRISCGVATGADSVFVHETKSLPSQLCRFAYPTISGRELGPQNAGLAAKQSMLIPYSLGGVLLAERELGAMKSHLSEPTRLLKLRNRTCVQRKPWYAFHETPPLSDILRPKILCKDITALPMFWIDRSGALVPRHSVYYIVPSEPDHINDLCDYLNSECAAEWLNAHCQRAANGYLRLQSAILKKLPIPDSLVFHSLPRSVGSKSRGRHRDADMGTQPFEFAR